MQIRYLFDLPSSRFSMKFGFRLILGVESMRFGTSLVGIIWSRRMVAWLVPS
jgi:hypothetical protein